jgi:hypothetical protein
MKLKPLTVRARIHRGLLALAVVVGAGVGAKAAFASGSCVDACVNAFGMTFENSRGDFFVLKDCAISELGTGTVYCTYARLPA